MPVSICGPENDVPRALEEFPKRIIISALSLYGHVSVIPQMNVWASCFVIQQIPDMVSFKKQFLIRHDDEDRRACEYYCFQAFGLGRHGDFLLHRVYEKVQDDACEHAAVVFT